MLFFLLKIQDCQLFLWPFLLGSSVRTISVLLSKWWGAYSCWFYFDGEFVVNIVVAFIIPKLALTVVSL